MFDKNQALKILKSWHLVEFFQTYNLEKEENSVRITRNELINFGDSLLPWLNEQAKRQLEISAGEIRYILHIGLFTKGEIERLSDNILGNETDPIQAYEQEQRLDTSGMTCFAKLTLDTYGAPNLTEMSVSTLPWALGHLQQRSTNQLSMDTYRRHSRLLEEQLSRINLALHPEQHTSMLDARALADLLQILTHWANYIPDMQFAVQLDWRELPPKKKEQSDDKTLSVSSNVNTPSADGPEGNENDDSEDSPEGSILPILNSFYIEDIERALLSIESGKEGQALKDYLSIAINQHPDLYSQDGLHCIIDKLMPGNTPVGRWPSDPNHSMSLMQQFAINTAAEELQNGGLISVNGPPGTGKTTLLRDMIAHNLVERATVLSGFARVEDTLDRQGFPVETLAGFEMVVASSNNAAVENISRELPQRKSLGKEFGETDYMSSVANQTNARKKKNRYQALKPEEQCWGMISAVLGKKANRSEFASRFTMDTHFKKGSEEENPRPAEFNLLNLWRWQALSEHDSFSNARRRFIELRKKAEAQQNELQEMAELHAELTSEAGEHHLAILRQEQITTLAHQQQVGTELTELEKKISLLDEQVLIAVAEEKQHAAEKPGFWGRLLQRQKYRSYLLATAQHQACILNLRKQRIPLLQAQQLIEPTLKEANNNLNNAKQRLTDYQARQHRLEQLHAIYSDMPVANPESDISTPELQRFAFWQNAQVNRLRSELFIAALDLHKTWLHEALKKSVFRKHILGLKDFLNFPQASNDILQHWRLLFMIVPVVSTTFASLGRMFSGVTQDQLGWLFIDEAGQAPPQFAVGGIWRAKRVLAVGDPLQIEPVFVTPARLVKYLTESILGSEAEKWNPGCWSVQQISDRANAYGCKLQVMNKPVWTGIPLWVHRRCIEPMFSLANHIAYNNRMIHGSDGPAIRSQSLNNDLENHWRISVGNCSYKQYKRELAEDTLSLLQELIQAGYLLPNIFVITPFKAVREKLLDTFKMARHASKLHNPTSQEKGAVTEWCKKNVGTVHTFQGKENDIVILVLGCDENNQGGATWAASKPNLLNVALTRAKKHIFVVGDPAVWQDKCFFNDVAKKLPLHSPITETQ